MADKSKPRISPVLARLIEEVRQEQVDGPTMYDRMHRRHNRSITRPQPQPRSPEDKVI